MTQGIANGSYLDLNDDSPWSDEQFQRKKRDETAANSYSEDRQNDLRTILIGHLLGWRTALQVEIDEAKAIMQATLTAYERMLAAQADYALRCQAQQVEAAQARLLQPANPDDPNDDAERSAAQATVSGASAAAMAVVTFRNRYPAPPP